jgi:secondary thiamine-phosphate synthase enzyme
MKSLVQRIEIETQHDTETINITETVRQIVAESSLQNGLVLVSSLHTTTAITVNEGLPDIEADIVAVMERLAPAEGIYRHARFLPSDGQMAVNAACHLRSALLGFQCLFPLENGQMVMGGRQTIYFVELDGPQSRTYIVQVLGE